jgi:predicted XRE-type DNA-binding protein
MNAEYVTGAVEIEDIPITASSGNVFADLGVAEPAEALLKAELARQIAEIIKERGLTQTAAARVLGTDQPKISALLRGRLTGFTLDRLARYASALGQQVEVIVRPREHDSAEAAHEGGATVTIPRTLQESLVEAASKDNEDLDVHVATILAKADALSRVEHRLDQLALQLHEIQERRLS